MRWMPDWIRNQVPTHLSPRVQSIMGRHLLREYYREKEEHRKANLLLEYKPLLPEQDLCMDTELMFMYQFGEH